MPDITNGRGTIRISPHLPFPLAGLLTDMNVSNQGVKQLRAELETLYAQNAGLRQAVRVESLKCSLLRPSSVFRRQSLHTLAMQVVVLMCPAVLTMQLGNRAQMIQFGHRTPAPLMLTPAEERYQQLQELQQQKVRVTRAAQEANADYLRAISEFRAARKARAAQRRAGDKPSAAYGGSSMASSRAALESLLSLDTSSMQAEQLSDETEEMELMARVEATALQYTKMLAAIDVQIADCTADPQDTSARQAALRASVLLDEAEVVAAGAERDAKRKRLEATEAALVSARRCAAKAVELRAAASEAAEAAKAAEGLAASSRAYSAQPAVPQDSDSVLKDMAKILSGFSALQDSALTAKFEREAAEAAAAAAAASHRVREMASLFLQSSPTLQVLFKAAEAAMSESEAATIAYDVAASAAVKAARAAVEGSQAARVSAGSQAARDSAGSQAAVKEALALEMKLKQRRAERAKTAAAAEAARRAVLRAVEEEQAGREQAAALAAKQARDAADAAEAAEVAEATAKAEVVRLLEKAALSASTDEDLAMVETLRRRSREA